MYDTSRRPAIRRRRSPRWCPVASSSPPAPSNSTPRYTSTHERTASLIGLPLQLDAVRPLGGRPALRSCFSKCLSSSDVGEPLVLYRLPAADWRSHWWHWWHWWRCQSGGLVRISAWLSVDCDSHEIFRPRAILVHVVRRLDDLDGWFTGASRHARLCNIVSR